MHPDRSGISHLQIAVVSLQQRFKNPVRYANPALPLEAVPAGRPRIVAPGNSLPGRALSSAQEVAFNPLRLSTSGTVWEFFGNNSTMIDHHKSVRWWWR